MRRVERESHCRLSHSQKIAPRYNEKSCCTDALSHAGRPTCFEPAFDATFSYTDRMCFGAVVVFGRACAALMNAFSGSESFDMVGVRI